MCHTNFHCGKEYLNISFVRVCKAHKTFSFEQFCTIVKIYLALRGDVVGVIDNHEVCHHNDIQDGQYHYGRTS